MQHFPNPPSSEEASRANNWRKGRSTPQASTSQRWLHEDEDHLSAEMAVLNRSASRSSATFRAGVWGLPLGMNPPGYPIGGQSGCARHVPPHSRDPPRRPVQGDPSHSFRRRTARHPKRTCKLRRRPCVPWFHPVQRSHEHLVQSKGVRTIFRQRTRLDSTFPRDLDGSARRRAEDEALVDELEEWPPGWRYTEVKQHPCQTAHTGLGRRAQFPDTWSPPGRSVGQGTGANTRLHPT